jgi:hypothetical protein
MRVVSKPYRETHDGTCAPGRCSTEIASARASVAGARIHTKEPNVVWTIRWRCGEGFWSDPLCNVDFYLPAKSTEEFGVGDAYGLAFIKFALDSQHDATVSHHILMPSLEEIDHVEDPAPPTGEPSPYEAEVTGDVEFAFVDHDTGRSGSHRLHELQFDLLSSLISSGRGRGIPIRLAWEPILEARRKSSTEIAVARTTTAFLASSTRARPLEETVTQHEQTHGLPIRDLGKSE